MFSDIDTIKGDLKRLARENTALREENAGIKIALNNAREKIKELTRELHDSKDYVQVNPAKQAGSQALKIHRATVGPMATRADDRRIEEKRSE